MLAIDISNWQGELGASWFMCAKRDGVEHVVVRASTESPSLARVARSQMHNAVAASLGLSIYVWVYWQVDPREAVRAALSIADKLPVHTVFLDVEEERAVPSPDEIARWLATAVDEIWRSGRAGIYTGKWWWDRYMPGRNDFNKLPLWIAYYDNQADLNFPKFGGWESCVMKQYSDRGAVCGVSPINLNFADDDYFRESASSGEEQMPGLEDRLTTIEAYIQSHEHWLKNDIHPFVYDVLRPELEEVKAQLSVVQHILGEQGQRIQALEDKRRTRRRS